MLWALRCFQIANLAGLEGEQLGEGGLHGAGAVDDQPLLVQLRGAYVHELPQTRDQRTQMLLALRGLA